MTISAWLIGSYRGLPEQTLTIEGAPQVIDAGSYYLYDATAALSLLTKVNAAMVAEVADGTAVLLRNRKVRLSGSNPFGLTWPADGVLRNLLGFSGNLAGQASYTAPNISPLLWSPGRPETPTMAPLGSQGHTRMPVFTAVSPYDGSISVVTHGSGRVFNEFRFPYVANARYQTAAELGGEFCVWFANVCALGRNLKLHRLLDESDASTDPITGLGSAVLGPYVYSPVRDGLDWTFTRSAGGNFAWTDRRHDATLPVHVVPEYSNG